MLALPHLSAPIEHVLIVDIRPWLPLADYDVPTAVNLAVEHYVHASRIIETQVLLTPHVYMVRFLHPTRLKDIPYAQNQPYDRSDSGSAVAHQLSHCGPYCSSNVHP